MFWRQTGISPAATHGLCLRARVHELAHVGCVVCRIAPRAIDVRRATQKCVRAESARHSRDLVNLRYTVPQLRSLSQFAFASVLRPIEYMSLEWASVDWLPWPVPIQHQDVLLRIPSQCSSRTAPIAPHSRRSLRRRDQAARSHFLMSPNWGRSLTGRYEEPTGSAVTSTETGNCPQQVQRARHPRHSQN